MEEYWKISSQLTEAGHIQYFHQTHVNTQVDLLRELIQSKDIVHIRRTGLHTYFEPTSGHIVPSKEALCPPTHISIPSLMLAPAFMYISHCFQLDQFPDPTHPAATRMLVQGNGAKHKTGTFPFTANPDLHRDSISRETPGDLDKKRISFISAKILTCFTRMVCMNLHYSHGSTKKVCV